VGEDTTCLGNLASRSSQFAERRHWVIAVLCLFLALAVFLAATPSGLLSKADMVGYAVCHRIGSHSFTLSGRQLPLCARCTGTFLGALIGLFGQGVVLRRGRAASFPPPPVLVILVGFTAMWMADGLNSYLALIGGPHLYEPTNVLRLTTGALNGTTMSTLVYPVFNISFWRRPSKEPALRGPGDLALLLAFQAALIGLILSHQPFLLYPLALLSAGSVLTLLSSVNTAIILILLRRDNSVGGWRQAIIPVSAGLILSIIQIGTIDLIRYGLTGTLDGIPTLQ
jgi:uncharacterized membrane protein